MFIDPKMLAPALTVGGKLLARKFGFRTLLDVIPLDPKLVKGSHGRVTDDSDAGPLLLSDAPELLPPDFVDATRVKELILRHVFE
jgi:hypothetical protein